MTVHAKPSALSLFERTLAAYVACLVGGDARGESRLESELANLGAPSWLVDNVRRSRGRWSVSDADRIDALVSYAAKVTATPGEVNARDADRLRAVGLVAFDIADLHNVVAYYNS
jgi:uncharacterized protein YciW